MMMKSTSELRGITFKPKIKEIERHPEGVRRFSAWAKKRDISI